MWTDKTRRKYLRYTSILSGRCDASKAGEPKKALVTLSQSMIDHGEEGSMQPRTCLLYAFTLSTSMIFGGAAMSADLPKEGTYKGTYAGVGTNKATKVGNDRLLTIFDETGLQTTDGFLDHTTWHCWGTGEYTNGMGQEQGRCIATDLAGDKVVTRFVTEKHAIDQKNFNLSSTCEGGTGRFAGATCSETDIVQANEFPSPSEGSYVVWVTFDGRYKLP